MSIGINVKLNKNLKIHLEIQNINNKGDNFWENLDILWNIKCRISFCKRLNKMAKNKPKNKVRRTNNKQIPLVRDIGSQQWESNLAEQQRIIYI